MRHTRLTGISFLLLLLALANVAAASASRPASVPEHYIAANPFFASLKLPATELTPEGEQRFANAWHQIELQHDSREIRWDGLRLFLGEGVRTAADRLWISSVDAEKLIRPLLTPAAVVPEVTPVRRIMIDAGHGGQDRGTRSDPLALNEKDVALDVALRLGAILRQQGFEVVQTRQDDTFVEIRDRVLMGEQEQVDLFISVHFNAAGIPTARGSETYVLTPATQRSTGDRHSLAEEYPAEPGNVTDALNAVLGHEIHRAMIARLGTVDRGLKRARFVVLRLAQIPSVLIEAGFLSHEEESREIATSERRGEIAEAMANGVVAYANQLLALQPPR